MLKSWIGAAVVMLLPTLSAATEARYNCTLTPHKGSVLKLREAIYTVDTGAGTASVFDPLVKHIHDAPVAARLSTRSDGAYQLKWRVRVPGTRTRTAPNHPELNTTSQVMLTVRFSARIDPQTGAVDLRGTGPGAPRIRASGSCALR